MMFTILCPKGSDHEKAAEDPEPVGLFTGSPPRAGPGNRIDEQALLMGFGLGKFLDRSVLGGEFELGYVVRQIHQQWQLSASLSGSLFGYATPFEDQAKAENLLGIGLSPRLGVAY
jgi:hypothetical protein